MSDDAPKKPNKYILAAIAGSPPLLGALMHLLWKPSEAALGVMLLGLLIFLGLLWSLAKFLPDRRKRKTP